MDTKLWFGDRSDTVDELDMTMIESDWQIIKHLRLHAVTVLNVAENSVCNILFKFRQHFDYQLLKIPLL